MYVLVLSCVRFASFPHLENSPETSQIIRKQDNSETSTCVRFQAFPGRDRLYWLLIRSHRMCIIVVPLGGVAMLLVCCFPPGTVFHRFSCCMGTLGNNSDGQFCQRSGRYMRWQCVSGGLAHHRSQHTVSHPSSPHSAHDEYH